MSSADGMNTRVAPRLVFSESKDSRCGSDKFFMLPQELMKAVMYGINGNSLNQLKIIVLLLGTKEGFRISTEYALEELHLDRQAYFRARKALVDKGWLSLKTEPRQIVVNIDRIWEDYYDSLRKQNIMY